MTSRPAQIDISSRWRESKDIGDQPGESVKEGLLKRQAGLWINHRKTIIVSTTDQGEATRIITSNLEQQGALSARAEISAEDLRDKRIKDHLGRYYDLVVECIRDAESILILGPGEAKSDLKKRLETAQLNDHIVAVESVERMTVNQLRTLVRQRFPR